eukprot:scaffold973_cov399-Prasinococcus_capsulatus_cf.AAC.15
MRSALTRARARVAQTLAFGVRHEATKVQLPQETMHPAGLDRGFCFAHVAPDGALEHRQFACRHVRAAKCTPIHAQPAAIGVACQMVGEGWVVEAKFAMTWGASQWTQ